MIRLFKSGLFVVLILLNAVFVVAPEALAAQITVTTDRTPVSIDESFRIIFSANESPDEDPDFSPLEQDFEIMSQSSSSNSSWINGKTSKTIQWTLTVMAKQAGNLVIPSVKFGSDNSEAGTILVTQGAVNKDIKTDEDLFLEVEATPESPYVQSQIIYTLRLYTRVNIAQASLSEPELADSVVEKLGEDSTYNTEANGINYSVTERKYAIFPQKSGLMTIKPLILNAQVISSGRPSFNGFFSQQMTKTKRVESKAITLNVKPVPAEFTGKHWISAEELHLKQEWSGDFQKMKVGEPLTRTLSLLAKGTTVGQLPELNTAKTDDQLKAYPDQPVIQEQKKPDGIIAFREEKIALIPSKSGDFILPAIEIPWFNTKTQKMELTQIPETTITAASIPGVVPQPVPAPLSKTDTAQKSESVQSVSPPQSFNIWIGVSFGLAFGWLATLIYFLTKSPVNKPATKTSVDENQAIILKASINNLKKACADNDAVAAKNSLIDWGRQQFNVSSLGAIAAFCDARLRDEILDLNQVLYGKESAQWQGKKLFQAFTENKARQKITSSNDSQLEPLYRL
jgi:hypothetical protein